MEGNALVSNDMLNDLAIAIKGCMTNPPSEGMRVQDMVENVRGIAKGKLTFDSGFVAHTDMRIIPDRLFSYYNIIAVDIPSVVGVGAYAFESCEQLTTVTLSNAKRIENDAFTWCTGLQSVSLPSVISVGYNAFCYNIMLESISLPYATEIAGYAFINCEALEVVSCPSVVTISEDAFNNCVSLNEVSLPEATSIGDYAFGYCLSLDSISLPKVVDVGVGVFMGCGNLASVSLPSARNIGSLAFAKTRITDLTLSQFTVEQMSEDEYYLPYSWGLEDGCTIHCSNGDLIIGG